MAEVNGGDAFSKPEIKKPEVSSAVQKLAGVANHLNSPDSPRDPTIREWKDLFFDIRNGLDLSSSQNISQLFLEGYLGRIKRSINSGEALDKNQETNAKGLSTEVVETWFKEGLVSSDQAAVLDKAYGSGALQRRLKNFK